MNSYVYFFRFISLIVEFRCDARTFAADVSRFIMDYKTVCNLGSFYFNKISIKEEWMFTLLFRTYNNEKLYYVGGNNYEN